MSNWRHLAWGIFRGLVVVWIVFSFLSPPKGIVLVGPQQHVTSINPKMGVHTRLTDEVDEWKIQRSLELVREMGASWIVEYFPWAYYEPEKGFYNWDHPDTVIRHACRQGLAVVARIGFVPQWARPEGSSDSFLSSEHYDDLGDFVYAFAQRYRGQVSHLIIWNEPNLSLEWGFRAPSPAEYAQMLRVVYPRAKQANPEVTVLGGALAPTLGAPDAMSDLAYLQGIYDAGATSYFDMLAVHAYGWRFPPQEPPASDAITYSRAELLREIMVQNGDAGKLVMITEGGWNDHPRWTKAVRPGQRIAYTLQAYDMAWRKWDWCQAVAWWAFRYPRPQPGYPDHFTFVTVDFTLKPLYLEVRRYARGEDVSEWMIP